MSFLSATNAIAFTVTLLASLALVLTQRWHGRFSLDGAVGVQKMHTQPTPRVGGVAIVLGLLAALYVVIEGLMGHTPSGWASLMTVTLLIAGVQFLILGVLGEYVGRSFMSANGKPQGVVREILPARDEGRAP